MTHETIDWVLKGRALQWRLSRKRLVITYGRHVWGNESTFVCCFEVDALKKRVLSDVLCRDVGSAVRLRALHGQAETCRLTSGLQRRFSMSAVRRCFIIALACPF